MLKAVIFDMDGVLVDSEPLHYEVNRLTMQEQFGQDLDYEYYKQYIGSTVMAMWNKIIKDFSIEGYTAEELFDLSEQIKERIVAKEGYPKIPGVVSFIKSISSKYKLAVASSSALVNIQNNVNRLGVESDFHKLVTGLSVPNPKPAPDIFLKAATELGVEPSECIVIEDSCNGVRAANNAGMACLGFINPSSGDQDLSTADYLFESFDSIDEGFLEMVHSHHHGEPWRVMETERLIIREMCPDDVEAIYKIYEGNDLRYTENLFDDIDEERQYIADYQKYIYNFYDFGIWLFQEKATGDIIGRGGVEYKMEDVPDGAIEIGYIIRPDKQGQGYAYEGLRAILDYVPDQFGIKQVRVKVHKDNQVSIGLAKKLGAKFGDEVVDDHIVGYIELK